MFTEAFDEERGFVVWLLTGTTNSDEDYQRYVDSIVRLDRVAAGKHRPVAMLVVEAGNPAPGPTWRRRIAAASTSLVSQPVFVLVTTSTLVRGVLTAINWLRPPSYPFAARATFEEGLRWVEDQRGPTEGLRELLASARARVP